MIQPKAVSPDTAYAPDGAPEATVSSQPDQPASTSQQPIEATEGQAPELTDRQRDALRTAAHHERRRAAELAKVLEDIAANGLPNPAECAPWEEVRERMWDRLTTGQNGARAAS